VDTYPSPVRFGVFELDLRTGELRKKGAKVKLDGQPIQILALLLERPGELLTHEEIRAKLWPHGTVVEFESSIKTALRKLRHALGDDAEAPRYIENLPRRGYRFIAPVDGPRTRPVPQTVDELDSATSRRDLLTGPSSSGPAVVPAAVVRPQRVTLRRLRLLLAGVFVLLLATGAFFWFMKRQLPSLPELKQRRLTSNSPEIPVLRGAISPDGKYVAYSDAGGLHLKVLESGEARTLPRPANPPPDANWSLAGWFPGGTQLLTNLVQPDSPSSIWMVSIVEDNPRLLREDATGWSVSPDGTHIAFTAGAPIGETCDSVGVPSYNREIWIMSSQGGNAQKVVAAAENECLGDVQWSPQGARIAYLFARHVSDGLEMSIRTSAIEGGRSICVISDPRLADFSWLPGGRLIYARFDAPLGSFREDGNLWEVPVDSRTGEPSGKPVQLTRWAGFSVEDLSSSVDGRRLAFTRRSWQSQAFIGPLSKDGTRMQPPRRLTFSEATDWPFAWTADSKAVILSSDRNGKWEVFKQALGQETAQLLATDSQPLYEPRLSADGAWVLYPVLPKSIGPSTPIPLMRVPVNGGPAQLVLEARNFVDFQCAQAPAMLCELNERSADRKLMATAFDPVKGRGRVLMAISNDPSSPFDAARLSPDGAHFAYLKFREPYGHIKLLSLDGRLEREITVKKWPGFTSLDWAPDGKAMYCGTRVAGQWMLLRVDLDGNVHVLWQHTGTVGSDGMIPRWNWACGEIYGIPSPDGRYMAVGAEVCNNNIWMVENF
jgi:DNA-binding winged helix-turn-helix (wHTH) protein/Tol biopolymer transport system component